MLDGFEERRLREIEARLSADDPHFVSEFRAGARHRPRRRLFVAAIVVGALLVMSAMLLGVAQLALLGLGVIAVALWRRRRGDTGEEPRSP